MNLEEIQKIIKMLDEYNLDELTLEEGELKLTLKRNKESTGPALQTYMQAPQAAPALQPTPPQQPQATQPAGSESAPEEPGKKYKEIRSPMVGTFYRAPSPEATPYIQTGDKVSKGKVICIIEAMKLMNEIESDIEGTIIDILVDNSQPVEYDQVLFLVDPS
jgi:acetyl-CoA carboxylase biotin carboxyl carrier protein